jgi:hypothetical protein
MVRNRYNEPKGRMEIKPVTIKTVDQAIYDYFDKKLALKVDDENGRKKIPIIYATGERWKLIRNNKGIRDDNGTLILPLLTIRRTEIDRTPGFGGMAQETREVVVSKKIHPETANFQNLIHQRKKLLYSEFTAPPIYEYFTIPFPDFATARYEIIIWTQYQKQMNEVLERIFYAYDHMDSFVMPVEYDGNEPKGDSYYFVGFREGTLTSQGNVEEFTDQERILKYSYSIKVPTYLMLDPKDEALSYGKDSQGKNVLYKHQSVNKVSLGETIVSNLSELDSTSETKPFGAQKFSVLTKKADPSVIVRDRIVQDPAFQITGSDNQIAYYYNNATLTGSQNLLVDSSTSTIYANNNDLILSSSDRSQIYVSGNFHISGDIAVDGSGLATSNDKVKISSNDTTANFLSLKLIAGPNITLVEANDGNNEELVISGSAGAGNITGSTDYFVDDFLDVKGFITSSTTSTVKFSSSIDLFDIDKNYHIRAIDNNLILSSSVGSNVYISSSLDILEGASGYKWRKLIDTTDYVTNPISTSSFTIVANTPGANIIAGMPLKWSQNSTTYYGICTDVSSTTITIAGPALTAAVDFDDVWYGREEDIDIVEMFVSDVWADASDDDLLKNDVSTEFRVKKAQSYLVYASVRSESVVGQPEVNIANADGAENVFYTNFTGSTGINESVVNIDLDNYLFTRNEKVFLRCLETGSLNGIGNDNLTVSLTFVTP